MKKLLSILLILAMSISMVTVVNAATEDVQLVSVDYVLRKGTLETHLTQLSNKMEVIASVKNVSSSSRNIKLRVDGYKYKDRKDTVKQSVSSEAFSFAPNETKEITVKLSDNVKTYCDSIRVFAVLDGGKEKELSIFPAVSLGIKVNGKEIVGYSDDQDEYEVCLDTPYPYFDVETRSKMQIDLDKGIDYKMPYTRTVKVAQIGKDNNHKIERTVKLKFTTTNPAPSHISNDDMILWLKSENNIDQDVYDKTTTKWSDLSGYKNNVEYVNDKWASSGLKVNTRWSKDNLTELPKGATDAINDGSYTIKFNINNVNPVANSNLCVIGSGNENLKLFVKKDTDELYFKWAGAVFTPQMVSVPISEAVGKENAITVNKETGEVVWYVDTVEKDSKVYPMDIRATVDKLTLSDVKIGNAGSVVFDEIKIFDKALTDSEVSSPDVVNADTGMTDWYNMVDTGITLCGKMKNGTSSNSLLSEATVDTQDDATDNNLKYFCDNYDDFVKNNEATLINNICKKFSASELDEDFASYYKVAGLAEESVLALKNKNGIKLQKDEIKSYVIRCLDEDVSSLMNDLSEGVIDGIVNNVNATKSGSDDEFRKKVSDLLVVAAIVNPKEYNSEAIAQMILNYSDTLGLNLNGFDKITDKNKRAKVAQAVVNAKPTTVDAFEKVMKDAMSDNGQTGGGVSAGGSNDSGSGLSSIVSNLPGSTEPIIKPVTIAGFTDMAGSEWVENALTYMVDKGYVKGISETEFAPKNNITRAEFVAIITRCENLEKAEGFDKSFDDVSEGFWGYDSVMAAYSNGIISGINETEFNPNGNITRQDIAVILYNVYKKHVENYEEKDEGFSDWDQVSDYAKESVGKLHALKVLNGYEGNYSPFGLCTRAEAVQAIYGYLQTIGQ